MRRLLVGFSALVAASLATASLAWACTITMGATFYDLNSRTSGPGGTKLTVFAKGASPSKGFNLVMDNIVTSDGMQCMDVLTTLDSSPVSDALGNIPNTSGTIPTWVPQGNYSICFRQDNGATATVPVVFTVT